MLRKVTSGMFLNAAKNGDHRTICQYLRENENIFQYLEENKNNTRGANIYYQEYNDLCNALLTACLFNHEIIVDTLLQTPGINVNYQIDGRTPLTNAMTCNSVNIVVALLATLNIDLTIKNKYDQTPIQEAIARFGHRHTHGHVITRLIRAIMGLPKQQEDISTSYEKFFLVLGYFNKYPTVQAKFIAKILPDIDFILKQKATGHSNLYYAARYFSSEIFTLLVEKASAETINNALPMYNDDELHSRNALEIAALYQQASAFSALICKANPSSLIGALRYRDSSSIILDSQPTEVIRVLIDKVMMAKDKKGRMGFAVFPDAALTGTTLAKASPETLSKILIEFKPALIRQRLMQINSAAIGLQLDAFNGAIRVMVRDFLIPLLLNEQCSEEQLDQSAEFIDDIYQYILQLSQNSLMREGLNILRQAISIDEHHQPNTQLSKLFHVKKGLFSFNYIKHLQSEIKSREKAVTSILPTASIFARTANTANIDITDAKEAEVVIGYSQNSAL